METASTKPKHDTWAHLKPNTPFANIFPENSVPIRSIFPMIPREEGCPQCYLVEGSLLADEQVSALARMLSTNDPNTEDVPHSELCAYIREGLPLRTDWFSGVGTSNPAVLYGMLELGTDLADGSEDELWSEADDEWPEEYEY